MNTIDGEAHISRLIEKDPWMMSVLRAAEDLALPDWWIGAGFLRNKVWNHIEGKEDESTRDVDLVYFDDKDIRPETDWNYDTKMAHNFPFAEWEIRNQARMHIVNGFMPFKSSGDGISHWVETATCVGVRLSNHTFEYLFCYGTEDLYGLVARPTPYFDKPPLLSKFHERVRNKRWEEKWPDLKVEQV